MKSTLLAGLFSLMACHLVAATPDEELLTWKVRASQVKVGMKRAEVERLLPEYVPESTPTETLFLPKGILLTIPPMYRAGWDEYPPKTANLATALDPQSVVTIRYDAAQPARLIEHWLPTPIPVPLVEMPVTAQSPLSFNQPFSREFFGKMGFVSGCHQMESYWVSRNVSVWLHLSNDPTFRGTNWDDRLLDPVKVELRSARWSGP